ncbi:MAG: hypothetical protein WCL38_03085 [Actinomycetota bacterium]
MTSETVAPTISLAVRDEFRRTLHGRLEVPITVAVNGVLVSIAWFFLPTKLNNVLFNLHSSMAFALVLAVWMYSDVPATNVLGPDPDRARAALDDPKLLRRLLLAKNFVLWCLVTPACVVVALVNGAMTQSVVSTLYTVLLIAIVPWGVLPIAGWLGIAYPYSPMTLRTRWKHRQPRRTMLWRWGALITLPYAVVPVVGSAIMAPSLVLWRVLSTDENYQKFPYRNLGFAVALACIVAIASTAIGLRFAFTIATKRRTHILEFLADPLRG